MKKNLTTFKILLIILALVVGAVVGQSVAKGAYYSDFELTPEQEYYEIIDKETGYIYYSANAHWEITEQGITLASMEAEYNNGSIKINSSKGFSDPKYMMYSPLTVEQLESQSFTEFSPKPKDEKDERIKELEARVAELEASIDVQVEARMKEKFSEFINNL